MYKIIWVSKFGKEEVDTADSFKEAEYLKQEYSLAFNSGYIIIKQGE